MCAGLCRTLGGHAGTRAPATYLYSLACAARASRMGGAGAHATVLCQVGQCGNQLGASLLDALADARTPVGDSAFFREAEREAQPAAARAVLLDTEPKVVNAALARRGRKVRIL